MPPQGSLATIPVSTVDSQIRTQHHENHRGHTYSPKPFGRKTSDKEFQRNSAPPFRSNANSTDELGLNQMSQQARPLHMDGQHMPDDARSSKEASVPRMNKTKISTSMGSNFTPDSRPTKSVERENSGANGRKHSPQLYTPSTQMPGTKQIELQSIHKSRHSNPPSSNLQNPRGVKRGRESPTIPKAESSKRPRLGGGGDTLHELLGTLAGAISGDHLPGLGRGNPGASRQRTLSMMEHNLARRKTTTSSAQSNDLEHDSGTQLAAGVTERSVESDATSQALNHEPESTHPQVVRRDKSTNASASSKVSGEKGSTTISTAEFYPRISGDVEQLEREQLVVPALSRIVTPSLEAPASRRPEKLSPDTDCGALKPQISTVVPPQGRQQLAMPLHSEQAKGFQAEIIMTSVMNLFDAPVMEAGRRQNASTLPVLQHDHAPLVGNPISDQVDAALRECFSDCANETEYWNRINLGRARHSRILSQVQIKKSDNADQPVSFASLKPLDLTLNSANSRGPSMQLRVESNPLSRTAKSKWRVPCSTYSTSESSEQVPEWAHYMSIRTNVLSYNNTTLQTLPYFGDDFDMEGALGQDLKLLFNLDIAQREDKVKRLLQAERIEEFADEALVKIGCDWESVLQVFLDPSPDIGSDLEARSAIARRGEWYNEAPLIGEERVSVVLSRLPPPDQARNAKAAVFCEYFHRRAGFTLWHIARRHNLVKPPDKQPDTALEDRECRTCRQEFCTEHGEMREYDDEASDRGYDSATGEEHALSTDIVHPLRVNFRVRSKFAPPQDAVENPDPEEDNDYYPRKDPRRIEYWMDADKYERMVELRRPFYPCSHPGQTCEEAQCSCVKQRVMCEKSCGCAQSCPRRFRGCACRTNHERSVCFQDDRCVCFSLWRECDPDLCGECGVYEVLDSVHRHDDDLLIGRCANAGLQRGKLKHTILGESSVHGLGLYACEDIKPHEFVGEYRGEIITKQEAERRGVLQKILDLSYLFNINAAQEVDATYMGNKTRFINHLKSGKANLIARISLVDTVHRIALYADKPIKAGDELFFDYGPEFPEHNLGGKVPAKSAPRARNTRDVASFYDAEVEEDEAGNRRIKKTMRGRPRKEHGKKGRPKVAARNGARKPGTSKMAASKPPGRPRRIGNTDGGNDEASRRPTEEPIDRDVRLTTESKPVIQDIHTFGEREATPEIEDDDTDTDFRPESNARDTTSESDVEGIADSEDDSHRRVARKTVRGARGPTTRTRTRSRAGGREH